MFIIPFLKDQWLIIPRSYSVLREQCGCVDFDSASLSPGHNQLIVAYTIGFNEEIHFWGGHKLIACGLFDSAPSHILVEGYQIARDCKAGFAFKNNVITPWFCIPVPGRLKHRFCLKGIVKGGHVFRIINFEEWIDDGDVHI